MLDGVILLWLVLAALAVAFLAIDIRNTPESPVLKWGFVAYRMNWRLIANHLKHGMMTVRPNKEMAGMAMEEADKSSPPAPNMTVLSFVALAVGLALGFVG